MDLLAQHEAFLRAIFDAPDDDTPRLVYADFLQENGEEDRAELIRVQCELAAEPWSVASERMTDLHAAEVRLLKKVFPTRDWDLNGRLSFVRGFVCDPQMRLEGFELRDVAALRQRIVRYDPHWFGANVVCVRVQQPHDTAPLDPARIDALLTLPACAKAPALDLRGDQSAEEDSQGGDFTSVYVTHPTISLPGVVALAGHKGMRRITELDLRNNDLDNDTARALVKSPYLDNLKRLQLLEGNRFRGKVWQQVIERFGEDVVG